MAKCSGQRRARRTRRQLGAALAAAATLCTLCLVVPSALAQAQQNGDFPPFYFYYYQDDYPNDENPIFPNCSTASYINWYNKPLDDAFAAIVQAEGIWSIESILFDDEIQLTNGQALDKSAQYCEIAIQTLVKDLRGRHGAVEEQYIYRAMCSVYCTNSDALHEAALEHSGCGCMDLSSEFVWSTTTTRGDWCEHNSARMLCKHLGMCGQWDCKQEDFMCPRYEFNQFSFDVKGIKQSGSCNAGSTVGGSMVVVSGVVLAATVALLVG